MKWQQLCHFWKVRSTVGHIERYPFTKPVSTWSSTLKIFANYCALDWLFELKGLEKDKAKTFAEEVLGNSIGNVRGFNETKSVPE